MSIPIPIKRRIKTIIFALPIAGILGLIGILLRGPIALPFPDSDSWAIAATKPIFLIASIVILLGYILPFVGFWALYRYLEFRGYGRLSFWGFIFSILGTALALPALGITGFVGPYAAQAYLSGNQEVASLISNSLTGTGFGVSIIAAICYTVGPTFLGIVVWKSEMIPKWIGIAFSLHGICLSLGFGMYAVLIVGWVLFTASSIGLTVILRRSLKQLPENP